MNTSGIYRIVNKIDEKQYIGSSIHVARRFEEHRYGLRHNRHANIHLQRAWNRDGEDAFRFEFLWFSEPDYLLADEQAALNLLPSGYNFADVASAPMAGRKHAQETLDKISKAGRGVPKTPEHRQKIGDAHRGVKRLGKPCPAKWKPVESVCPETGVVIEYASYTVAIASVRGNLGSMHHAIRTETRHRGLLWRYL